MRQSDDRECQDRTQASRHVAEKLKRQRQCTSPKWERQWWSGERPLIGRWPLLCVNMALVCILLAPALAWPADPSAPTAPWFFCHMSAALVQLVMILGVSLVPLIMAYRPEEPRAYVFEKALEESAGAFLSRLTPAEAQRYVAIIGAGPAGLRTAELIVALNRYVPTEERKKVLLLDRNPVLCGLGAYGIPPVKKQGVLKDGVVKQAQGIMHGFVGKREWQNFPEDQFLQVVDSAHARFFPNTDVGHDVTLEQFERLGIPLVIATGAQQPRVPTDTQGHPVPGRPLAGVVAATSEFFRQIGTQWLTEKKGVQGLRNQDGLHDFHSHKAIMVYGGGNVASDAFMWAFRNTPPETDVLLVYRGELHCMTNMSRPYYKPIDAALQVQRAPSPVFTPADLRDLPALCATIKERQHVIDMLIMDALAVPPGLLWPVTEEQMITALNTVLRKPDLVQWLSHIERGSFRLDLHPIHEVAMTGEIATAQTDSLEMLTLARTVLEMEYPNELRRLHRANIFGLLTVEAYLDKAGRGQITHVRLRKHRRGDMMLDRKTGRPVLLRSNVVERDNIMRHRYTKEKLYKWSTVPTEECIELAVDCVIEAIGDVVQPLEALELTAWQSLKGDLDTGRVDGRRVWVAGQALTQKGKVRDSYVSALNTVIDMGPVLYPHSWEKHQLLRVLLPDIDDAL